MAERAHKRKRSIEDAPADLSNLRTALNHLNALKTELAGIQEAEEELDSISKHTAALKVILKSTKQPRINFSTVTRDDLSKAGIVRKLLSFRPDKITELLGRFTPAENAEILDLHSRLKKMYTRVNMGGFEASSRMVLDAILLSVTETASFEQRSVVVLPGMRMDHIQLTQPVTGFELSLSGNIDYAVIEYDDVDDTKDRLLAPHVSSEDALKFATGCLFLAEVEHKHEWNSLIDSTPKAVSQAVALLKSTNTPEVRFCLSDGQFWVFFILKSKGGTLTFYESVVRRLDPAGLEISDKPLREILLLLSEWLRPTTTDLFKLGA